MTDASEHFKIGDTAQDKSDYDLARQSFERGASLGDEDCLSRLAHIYDLGLGVKVDKPLAMRLYKKAWRRGSHVAPTNIAILYREQGKHRLTYQWFMRAASANDGDALVELAKCYLHGTGVRRSMQNAQTSLASAVESNCITEAGREEAQAMLGDLHSSAA